MKNKLNKSVRLGRMTKRRLERSQSNLKIVHEELTDQFDELRKTNDSIFSVNSALNGIIASSEKYEDRLKQIIDIFRKQFELPDVVFASKTNLIEEYEYISTLCHDIIQNTSQDKITDPISNKLLIKLNDLFIKSLDLSEIFFKLQKLPNMKRAAISFQFIVDPPNPLEFTKLIKVTPAFLKSNPTHYDKVCALQEVNTKLMSLIEKLTDANSVLVAKNDENKLLLQNPSVSIVSKHPQFQTLIRIHKNTREKFSKMLTINTKNINEFSSTIGQIRANFHGTGQYLVKSINEIKNDSSSIRQKYTEMNIKLAELRAIKVIKSKYSSNSIQKCINSNKSYIDAETKMIESIIDTDKLKAFLDNLQKFGAEANATNQEFRETISKLDEKIERSKPTDSQEMKQLKAASEIILDQIHDGFTAYAHCFEVASQMTADVEEFVKVFSTTGKKYESVDVLETQAAMVPADNWYKLLIDVSMENLSQKKDELKKINKEIETLESQTNSMKSNNTKHRKSHSKDAIKCEDCKRNLCLGTCGHTFCEKCLKKEKCHNKCPYCMKSFKDEDVIKVSWE